MSIVCFRFCQTLFNWLAWFSSKSFFMQQNPTILILKLNQNRWVFQSLLQVLKVLTSVSFVLHKEDSSKDGSFLLGRYWRERAFCEFDLVALALCEVWALGIKYLLGSRSIKKTHQRMGLFYCVSVWLRLAKLNK